MTYSDSDEPSQPKSIGSLLPKQKPIEEKKKGGVNSPFNNAVDFVVVFMGDDTDPKKFGYWCARLRGMTPQQIFAALSRAKAGNKPRALFEYIVKQHQKLSTQKLDTNAVPGV